jgi:hypothetical protein
MSLPKPGDFTSTWLRGGVTDSEPQIFDLTGSAVGLSFHCSELLMNEFALSADLTETEAFATEFTDFFADSSSVAENLFDVGIWINGARKVAKAKHASAIKNTCQLLRMGEFHQHRWIQNLVFLASNCPQDFHAEYNMCREDGGNDWTCPGSCEVVSSSPFCVEAGTTNPCWRNRSSLFFLRAQKIYMQYPRHGMMNIDSCFMPVDVRVIFYLFPRVVCSCYEIFSLLVPTQIIVRPERLFPKGPFGVREVASRAAHESRDRLIA